MKMIFSVTNNDHLQIVDGLQLQKLKKVVMIKNDKKNIKKMIKIAFGLHMDKKINFPIKMGHQSPPFSNFVNK